jgi:diguanylate cyclase (GGDEF)-like protein
VDRTLILVVLLVAVVANVVFIGFALLTLRRRNARDERAPAPGGILAAMPPAAATRPPTAGPAPSLAGAAALSSSVAPTTMTILPRTITTVVPMSDRGSDMTDQAGASARWSLPPHEDPRADATIDALVRGESTAAEIEPGVDPLVDPVTGFATRLAWEEAFQNEDHRLARYGRPVTVLVAELDGLEALAARLGREPADRLIPPVATALRREARAADVLARVDHGRFVGLLPETDEIAAINYVERVRSACDMWLAAGAVAVRLAIGWAQAPAGGRLDAALRLADDRMNADRRRQARTAAAVPGGPTTPGAEAVPAESAGAPLASAPTPAAEAARPEAARPEAARPEAARPAPAVIEGQPAAPPASATLETAAGEAAAAGSASPSTAPPPSFVPDGPYPGSNGNPPKPISVIDSEKTYY